MFSLALNCAKTEPCNDQRQKSVASISVQNVSVDLPIYTATARSLRHTLASISVGGKIRASEGDTVFVRALDNISLELSDGEHLGIIGRNGAGKTTLLRVLSGLLEPTAGNVQVKGQVSTLLNIDSLMDLEMTGEENIRHVSALVGLKPHEGKSLLEDVTEFSELADFMQLPVRVYSPGMRVRLSFALMTAQHPEILLLDESISAGDDSFTEKANERFMKLAGRTRIMVLATHSKNHLRKLCKNLIWLEKGRIRALGPIEEVLAAYERDIDPIIGPLMPSAALNTL